MVVAHCNRRMRSSNVQGFVSRVLTLYEEEEEDCAPLHGYRRMRSSIFTFHSSNEKSLSVRCVFLEIFRCLKISSVAGHKEQNYGFGKFKIMVHVYKTHARREIQINISSNI